MKIEMIKKGLLSGLQNATGPGVVVESDNPATITEFKALVNVGYAKVSTKAADITIKGPINASPPISGIVKKVKEASAATGDDADLLAILEGNTGEVTEALSALDKDQIARLGELEAEGGARKGVTAAINEALAAE